MTDEFDIVNDLIKNEKDTVSDAPKKRKKKIEVNVTPRTGLGTEKVHEKHMDPPIKGKDATSERSDKEHWAGDCLPLTKAQRDIAGLPDDAYIYVKHLASLNSSACVFDPVHWIYGWGNNTSEAIDDCLINIRDWKAGNPDLVAGMIEGWKDRLAKYKHPMKYIEKTVASKAYKVRSIENKGTTDILQGLGL